MFVLKKIISGFFMPLTLTAGILAIGLVLLWFSGRKRAARVVLTAGVLMLVAMGYGVLFDAALAGLERRYPPLDVEAARKEGIRWVVVLAGGHVSDGNLPVTSQLLQETQVRLVEGIRIHRNLPGSRLLVSGGSFFDPKAGASLMAELACDLGVDREDIVLEDASKDTAEEARLIGPIVGRRHFILVTSAYHMPRSMALFRAQGMQPLAAPVGHLVIDHEYMSLKSFFPRSEKIRNCEIVIHEVLGMVHAYFTGKFRPREPGKREDIPLAGLNSPTAAHRRPARAAVRHAGGAVPPGRP